MDNSNLKTVQVLLSTYNGEKYIDEQMESLFEQEGVLLKILVRDDGSTDGTIIKLEKWEKQGKIRWYQGNNLGPARSFMDLIMKSDQADYYAFCDQDDVWDKDKLKIAVGMLEKCDKFKPALYFSNQRLVSSDLTFIKSSNLNPRITLGSSLLINPVTGCTEVFNNALINILRIYNNKNLYMHDAWSYRVCMAMNGNIIFDKIPHISYRQHEHNVIGGISSPYKKYKRRIKNVLFDRKRTRENDAVELINGYCDIIPKDNLMKIKKVAYYRQSLVARINLIMDTDMRTDSFEYNFSFFCAVILDAF